MHIQISGTPELPRTTAISTARAGEATFVPLYVTRDVSIYQLSD